MMRPNARMMLASVQGTDNADLELSRPVHLRAKLVKVMKTAATILEVSSEPRTCRVVSMLISQLTEVMPELAEIGPWQASGSQRSLEELGRAAERQVSDEMLCA